MRKVQGEDIDKSINLRKYSIFDSLTDGEIESMNI